MVHRIHRDSDHQVVAFDFNEDAVSDGRGARRDRRVLARGPRVQARGAADGVDHGPGRRPDRADGRRSSPSCSSEGDTIVDGGNTQLARRRAPRAAALDAQGIHYVDVGTSGGVWGLEVGYCMMVGGHEESVERLAPILDVLAPPDGWRHFGDAGAGHFVKMVHNGVEYGIMQAYAEGFELMHKSQFPIDAQGGLRALEPRLGRPLVAAASSPSGRSRRRATTSSALGGSVSDSGEGRWTIADAIDLDVPTPVITAALYARFYSRKEGDYTHKRAGRAAQPVRRPRGRACRRGGSRWPAPSPPTPRASRSVTTRSSRASSGSRSRRRRW